MQIDEAVFDDVTVLTCKGKITLDEGDVLLRDKVNSLMSQGCLKVVFDWAEVPYIDSAGLHETVRSYTTVSRQRGRLVFCNLTKRINDLFSITKLLTVFETYDSIYEAVKSFGQGRFEVSCPSCGPTTWANYWSSRLLLSCTECDARFSPRVDAGMLAPLETSQSREGATVVTAQVSDVWWFTYYENGYGQEGVHLRLGRPSIVAITGRLDLFALDMAQLALESVPAPRRVMFDTSHVRVSSPAGSARLNQLCDLGEAGNRSVIFSTTAERDRAIAELGNLDGAAQCIDVVIRLRS
jgi:anti-sigma B factor antagonist